MHFRTILSGTLAALLVAATPVHAQNGAPEGGFTFRLPTLGVLGGKQEKQVQLAQQSGVAGLAGIEDQIRQLNGKVEELNFQILQMQEQIRKQQEDNEFRLQQLEEGGQGGQKKSDAGGTDTSIAAVPGASPGASPGVSGDTTSGDVAGGSTVEDVIVDSGDGEPGRVIPGTPPRDFGTITVDKDGNVIDAGAGTQSVTAAQPGAAATPPADNA